MRLSTFGRIAAMLVLCSPAAMAQSERTPGKPAHALRPHDLSGAARTTGTALRRGGALSETFDEVPDGDLPDGWTQFEAGTGSTDPDEASSWAVLPYSDDPAEGKAAGVFFEDVASGLAIDYLVTPPITVGATDQLRAALAQLYTANYGSVFEIRLSTTTGTTAAAFSVLLASYTEATLPTLAVGPLNAAIDLSAYAGQSVYIAFVLKNDDGDAFVVDDVTVQSAPTQPAIQATPAALTFGRASVGTTTAPQVVRVSNSGGGTLTLSGITLTGPNANQFTLNTAGTTLSLAPQQSTTFTVAFAPTVAGAATASVAIASNAAGSPTTIGLSGTGTTPPPNDDVASATVITGSGTVAGNNFDATLEAGEPVPTCQDSQGASVWWSYTPAADGSIVVDLSNSDFDTILTLYGPGRTEIACDDDGGDGLTSRILASVTGGTTYLIRVAGYDEDDPAQGEISFAFTAGPVLLASSAAGNSAGEPTFNRPLFNLFGECVLSGTGTAVAYDAVPFTAGAAGLYEITTDFTAGQEGYILFYDGAFSPADPCANLVEAIDPFPETMASFLTDLVPSTTYTLVGTGFSNTDSGPFTVSARGPATLNFNPVAGEPTASGARTSLTATPNPARGAARVSVTAATAQDVTVAVYDVTGRRVATLFQGAVAAGQTVEARLDAATLPSGVYVVRATGADVNLTQRVTVVR